MYRVKSADERAYQKYRHHLAELEAAIDRIRRMHNNGESDFLAPGKWCAGCGEVYPCKTIRILQGVDLDPLPTLS